MIRRVSWYAARLALTLPLVSGVPWARGETQAAPRVPTSTLPDASFYTLPATWTAHDGSTMDLSSLRGQTVVLAMVYTSCIMTCPLITSDMQAVQRLLPANVRPHVRFVLASFDPARDSVAALRAHVLKMGLDSQWLALRAPPTTVRQLAVMLGVRYRQLPSGDFDHSNIISVLDANGLLRFQSTQMPADRSALVRAVLAASTR